MYIYKNLNSLNVKRSIVKVIPSTKMYPLIQNIQTLLFLTNLIIPNLTLSCIYPQITSEISRENLISVKIHLKIIHNNFDNSFKI